MDYKTIEKHFANLAKMNDTKDKMDYIHNLPEEERKEMYGRLAGDGRYGMPDKQELDSAKEAILKAIKKLSAGAELGGGPSPKDCEAIAASVMNLSIAYRNLNSGEK